MPALLPTHSRAPHHCAEFLLLPDGTQYNSRIRNDGTVRESTAQVEFVMKLDVNSANGKGVGAGTTGWFKVMDDTHPGGAVIHYADGDANGDLIVSYTGYSGYNASAPYLDGYGREKCCGAMTGPTSYLVKLKKDDGSEVWKHEVPHHLVRCRAINDGSFFCAYSMHAADGPLDFKDTAGNGVTMESVTTSKTGVIKYNAGGIAQWAKPTHDSIDDKYLRISVNGAGTLLAIAASSEGRGAKDVISRINTADGAIMWTDNAFPYGTHGFRGVEVSDDGNDVYAFGQMDSPIEITDTLGSTMTLNTRGTYSAFVATFNAADGSGKWAIDGGSGGMDYFFILSVDATTGDVYIGGQVYGHPPSYTWGDVTRANAMIGSSTAVDVGQGSIRAFFAQIKPTTVLPYCLNSCTAASAGTTQASAVKTGHCYIDRHCYKAGDFAPYENQHCMKCDPTASAKSPVEWSGPDTTSNCFIGGKCVAEGTKEVKVTGTSRYGPTYGPPDPCSKCIPSASTIAYSPVAEKGCMVSTTHALAQRPPAAPMRGDLLR